GQKKTTNAGSDGYWRVELDPMEANADGESLIVRSGENTVELEDLVVGEVWIAAGQSNMNAGGPDKDTGVYPFYESPDNADSLPDVRTRYFGYGASLEPQADVPDIFQKDDARWVTIDFDSGKSQNPARYFARILRDRLEVPVGIIHVAVSGINQTAWLSRGSLESFPGKGDYANAYEQFFAEREARLSKNKGEIRSWADFKEVEEKWMMDPQGRWPGRGMTYVSYPTALYNTRIVPLAPYAIRGVIWHQGEAGPRNGYDQRLVAMFQQWRELFGQDFYVIWGTLSKDTGNQPPLEPSWTSFYRDANNSRIRNALNLFGDDPKVEYVEFYDLGNDDTHFTQKAEAGRRMGLAGLEVAYGIDTLYTGPRLIDQKFDGDKVYLKFSHVGEGLVYEPSIDGISGFVISGPDGQAEWAEVRLINEDTIECSHPSVPDPVFLVYGKAENPHETLFNSDGIPATTFYLNESGITLKKSDQANKIVSFESNPAKGSLHLQHVRRDGYIFELRKNKKRYDLSVARAWVPDEWEGVEVLQAGQPVAFESFEEDGRKYVRFELKVNSPPIVVANQGHAEEFLGIDRF
ncbi:MAG: sialate O-acetylesterase, partial [Puniceicoccales bacterium]